MSNSDFLGEQMYQVLKMQELPPYMTLKEFCHRIFPISQRTVWRMISTGEFPKPMARIGGKTAVWKTEELLTWIEKQKQREQSHRPVSVAERKRKSTQ
jgi:predicted DNA-binding transcriptional regulator AlpA